MNKPVYSLILELRMYTLYPGRREELIRLFEREFLETQEAVGIQVLGQFYDLDDRTRFIWLRGFHDMAARAEALHAFYSGPIWKAHREAANATMIDSDNVLVEAAMTVRLLNREIETGLAVFKLTRVAGSWKLSGVEIFEVR